MFTYYIFLIYIRTSSERDLNPAPHRLIIDQSSEPGWGKGEPGSLVMEEKLGLRLNTQNIYWEKNIY